MKQNLLESRRDKINWKRCFIGNGSIYFRTERKSRQMQTSIVGLFTFSRVTLSCFKARKSFSRKGGCAIRNTWWKPINLYKYIPPRYEIFWERTMLRDKTWQTCDARMSLTFAAFHHRDKVFIFKHEAWQNIYNVSLTFPVSPMSICCHERMKLCST